MLSMTSPPVVGLSVCRDITTCAASLILKSTEFDMFFIRTVQYDDTPGGRELDFLQAYRLPS